MRKMDKLLEGLKWLKLCGNNKAEIARRMGINRSNVYRLLDDMRQAGLIDKECNILDKSVEQETVEKHKIEEIKTPQVIKGEIRDLDYVLDKCLEAALERVEARRTFIYDTKIVVINYTERDNRYIKYTKFSGAILPEEIKLLHGFGLHDIRQLRRELANNNCITEEHKQEWLNKMIEKNNRQEKEYRDDTLQDLIVDFGNRVELSDNDIELFKAQLEVNERMAAQQA